jgi:hypothetical protein
MVMFSPTTPTPSSGQLSVLYNGASPATSSLSGNGTTPILRAPTVVNFGPVAAGATGVARPITIINLSRTATVQMGTTPIPSGPFMIASNTCSNAALAPHGRCAIGVQSMPPPGSPSRSTTTGSLGPLSFTYGSNPGSVPAITLNGRVR